MFQPGDATTPWLGQQPHPPVAEYGERRVLLGVPQSVRFGHYTSPGLSWEQAPGGGEPQCGFHGCGCTSSAPGSAACWSPAMLTQLSSPAPPAFPLFGELVDEEEDEEPPQREGPPVTPGGLDDRRSPGGGSRYGRRAECCPRLFYPENIAGPHVTAQGEDARLPQYEYPLGEIVHKVAAISFSFTWRAIFAPTPAHCFCDCCEFRQELVQNDITLKRQGESKKSQRLSKTWKGEGAGEEDCRWTFRLYRDGDSANKPTGKRYPRFGGPGTPPSPYRGPPKSVLVAGPECFGHRTAGRGGYPKPDPGYDSGNDCIYKGKDVVQRLIPPKCTFTWTWRARAYILDTCAGGKKEPKSIHVVIAGRTDAEGEVKESEMSVQNGSD